jgi:hypothetical protein
MKSPLKKLTNELWQECRRIVKARYIKNGKYYCFTCDKEISGKGCQLGHMIPRSVGGALLRFHLDNLRLQCYYCNINLGGNGSEFYPRLVKEIGQEKVDYLFILKRKSVKAFDYFTILLKKYTLM